MAATPLAPANPRGGNSRRKQRGGRRRGYRGKGRPHTDARGVVAASIFHVRAQASKKSARGLRPSFLLRDQKRISHSPAHPAPHVRRWRRMARAGPRRAHCQRSVHCRRARSPPLQQSGGLREGPRAARLLPAPRRHRSAALSEQVRGAREDLWRCLPDPALSVAQGRGARRGARGGAGAKGGGPRAA